MLPQTIQNLIMINILSNCLDSEVSYGKVPNISSSIQPGTYLKDKLVQLSSTIQDASIYYTLDGTDPSEQNGILYTTPISLVQYNHYTLKAVGFFYSRQPSDISTFQFFITDIVQNVRYSIESDVLYNSTRLDLSYYTEYTTSIYYTTDDSQPSDTNGTLYFKFINLVQPVTIKAVAYRQN